MGNLTAFLAQNAKRVENVKLVVSDRFTDEDGKPLEWEVRCISSREDETLRRDCQYRVQVPGKRGSFRQEFDNVLYLAKLAAACTVYPNLNDAELQDSYGKARCGVRRNCARKPAGMGLCTDRRRYIYADAKDC